MSDALDSSQLLCRASTSVMMDCLQHHTKSQGKVCLQLLPQCQEKLYLRPLSSGGVMGCMNHCTEAGYGHISSGGKKPSVKVIWLQTVHICVRNLTLSRPVMATIL